MSNSHSDDIEPPLKRRKYGNPPEQFGRCDSTEFNIRNPTQLLRAEFLSSESDNDNPSDRERTSSNTPSLENDSGPTSQQSNTTQCFGTIDNLEVRYHNDISWLFDSKLSPFVPVGFHNSTNSVTVVSDAGQYIGVLSSNTAKTLQQVSIEGVKFEAFVEKSIGKKLKPGVLCILVNVYGPSASSLLVGDILMRDGLYLQSPRRGAYDTHYRYANPQCFSQDSDDEMDIDVGEPNSQLRPHLTKEMSFEVRDMLQDLLPPVSLNIDRSVYEMSNQLKSDLLEHQVSAVQFMSQVERSVSMENANVGGILADEPGLGKTLTALSLVARSLSNNAQNLRAEPTLIIVPASVLPSWLNQIEEHFHARCFKVTVYIGPRRKEALVSSEQPDIVLTSYSTLVSDLNAAGLGSGVLAHNWARVIIDEAHFIKDRSTKRFEALCALKTRTRWCLTGTPIQNKLEDLGALLMFLKHKPFDKLGHFQRKIVTPMKHGDSSALYRLQRIMSTIMIRRTKSMIDLPPRRGLMVDVGLTPAEREFYNVARDKSNLLIQQSVSKNRTAIDPTIIQSILRQRQVANHGPDLLQRPIRRLFERIAKVQAVAAGTLIQEEFPVFCESCHLELPLSERIAPFEECLHMLCSGCVQSSVGSDDMAGGCPLCSDSGATTSQTQSWQAWASELDYQGPSSKVQALIENIKIDQNERTDTGKVTKSVVFSQWTRMLYLVGLALEKEKIGFARFDGIFSMEQRQGVLSDFNNNEGTTVLLISIGAGGVGLNLTTASSIHLLEPHWNPMVETQALDRVHRIGQRNTVKTYRYIARDTFDESIALLQSHKLEMAKLALADRKSSTEEQRGKLAVSELAEPSILC